MLQPFSAPSGPRNTGNWIFPVLEAAAGETPGAANVGVLGYPRSIFGQGGRGQVRVEEPRKKSNNLGVFIFRFGSKNNQKRLKTEQVLSVLGSWCPPQGVCALYRLSPLQALGGRKRPKIGETEHTQFAFWVRVRVLCLRSGLG